MKRNPNATTISIDKSTRDRLSKLMKYGQTYDGMIREIIDRIETKQGLSNKTIYRLETYRDTPRDTIEDLINYVLDEADRKIEQVVKGK